MAKDYFQDIVPPANSPRPTSIPSVPTQNGADEVTRIPIQSSPDSSEISGRSIRNIAVSPSRPRSRPGGDMRDIPPNLGATRPGRSFSRFWLWSIAAVSLLILAAMLFVALRPSRVTVVPRTHALSFSNETFSAYPEATAIEGALTYQVETIELDDTEIVPSDGVVQASEKASGNITIVNNHQTTPLRLLKNTRFASASGQIFRAPAEVMVPAKVGSTAGRIEITVVADQPGEASNVPAGKFTLPGLQSSGNMYRDVYAESSSSMSGGFVGERPGVAPGALESAIAEVRTRLEAKIMERVAEFNSEKIVFSDLMQITYRSMPNTTEAEGKVRIHEVATVLLPVFESGNFTREVTRSAVSDTENLQVRLLRSDTFRATSLATTSNIGVDAVSFSLSGNALLVWDVDEAELQDALAGKDEGAFEAVVGSFPGIEEARARIEPFWKNSFPTKGSSIKIDIKDPSIEA